jgi:hypothetical protein
LALSIKDELLSLEARKAELQSRLEAPGMPELLHPRMSDVYREKGWQPLSGAGERGESHGRSGRHSSTRRGIVLERNGGRLKITLKGDLARNVQRSQR